MSQPLRVHLGLALALVAAVLGCSGDDAVGGGATGGSGVGASGGTGGGQGGGGAAGQLCGNGVVEGSEACDDGGPSPTCNADCSLAECGDGVANVAAGELCDDGNTNAADACDGCMPKPIELEQGYWDSLWPAVTVTSIGGQERFLVGYRSGAQNDVVVSSYDPTAALLSGPTVLATGYGAGSLDIAASPQGGALVVWQASGSGSVAIHFQRLDETLAPLSSVGQLGVQDRGDPRVAAGADGGYCIAAFLKSLAVPLRCLPSIGDEIAGASFPSTFGGIYYEGTHDLIALGQGYLFSYVPDDVTQDIVAYPLSAQGQTEGQGFKTVDFVDPYYSFVPKGAGAAGSSSFVSLGGELAQGTYAHTIYYRLYASPSEPLTDLTPVSSAPDGTEHAGVVARAGSGRMLIAWTAETVLESGTNAVMECVLRARRFEADGTPLGDDWRLYDPGAGLCPTGVRAAADAAGNVMLTWMLAELNQTAAIKQLMVIPGLLAP